MRALISINGYDLPTPSTYLGNTATLVDSARNVSGYVVGAVIREDVAKVEATWRYLTAEQWSEILKRFHTRYGGSFYQQVTFYNQTTANWETRQMYVGDRTTSGAFRVDDTGAPIGWLEPKLHLIEV